MEHDLIVIGGGAAGLAAARAARRRRARVALISDAPLGGDCTFTGCVPSKTLLSGARRGLSFSAAMSNVVQVIERVAHGESEEVLRAEGVDVIRGRARFLAPSLLEVDGSRLRAARVVIATGAGPLVPPIPGLDRQHVLTNDNVFRLAVRPERLAILGGGPIGVELAEAFARLGSRVTLVEAAARLLPREEPEASAAVEDYLVALGVAVRVATTCVRVTRVGRSSTLELSPAPSVDCDALVVAVGRSPSSASLDLDAAGVARDARGLILVDARLRTSARGVYAAGDVSQSLQFTHVADETGRIAAANALSRLGARRFHPEWVPMVTYTGLEVARVGVTEAQAGPGARVAHLPMSDFDRAAMSGEERGFVKIIAGPRRVTGHRIGGEILGASIVAPRAGDMLAEIVLAMRAHLYPARLAATSHAYPTWSTAVQMAAAQFFGDFGGRRARPANFDKSRE